MKEKDCVICSKGISTKTNAKARSKAKSANTSERNCVAETEENCVTLEKQLPVIFLLRKLLNIPEEMCTKFLQNNGNPVSWIFWCDSCAKLISDAEHLFKEIQQLQKKLYFVASNIKNTIALSADVEENCGKVRRHGTLKTTRFGPGEEIRSYIIQEFQSLENSKVDIKTEDYDNDDIDFEMDPAMENIDEFNNIEETEDFSFQDDKLKSKPRSPSRRLMKVDENVNDVQDFGINESEDFLEWKPEEYGEDSDSASEEDPLDLKNEVSKDISEEQKCKIEKVKHTVGKGKGLVKCEICFQEFRDWSRLRGHFLRQHGEFPYSCEHCKYKAVTKEELKMHQEKFRCEGKTIVYVYCDTCNKRMTSESVLKKHREIFHGLEEKIKTSEEIVFKCQKCDKTCKRIQDLRYHCKKKHAEDFEKLFPENIKECKICGMTFKRSARDHYQLKHIEEFKIMFPGSRTPREFKCATVDCNYKTIDHYRYQQHVKTHLVYKERPFVCDICGEAFTEKPYFEHHQQSKHYEELGLNPFKCDQCGKILSSRSNLQAHIRTVHQKAYKFKCPLCNRGLPTKGKYDLHMKKHEGIKTALCPECGAAFVSQGVLNIHVRRVHRNERPFPCKQCPIKFKFSTALSRHVKSVHSNGVKPFKCDFCPKAFPVREYLYEHLRSHRKKNQKL